MNQCKLRIVDQVNVKFDGLDPFVRRKIVERLKFMIPHARHMPAFKLGRWDGKVAFATVGGGTFLNLLDRILPLVIEADYEIELVDERADFKAEFPEVSEDMLSDICWPPGHVMAGEPIMLRDYQVEAIQRYLENQQSIQCISTGAGKTLLTATLSKLVEPMGRTIVIVPSKSLVEQTEEDYRNLGLDVGVFYGDRKEWNKTHTIATWQSLSVFSKKSKLAEVDVPLSEFLEGVVCVMVDEVHSAKADNLKELLAGPMAHIPIRWGLTGTVPKEDYEFLTLLSTLGPVVGEIRAADLQDQGVLASCDVNIMQLKDDHVEFRNWHEEYDYLTSDKTRLNWIADTVTSLSESGNTLILVERVECGKYLNEHIPNSVFVSGVMKTKDRKKEYKEVQSSEGKIIIATYGVAAVGINVPRIFNLVLVEAGKSFVRVIQSIGRGIRKAQDKEHVNIYDICSSLKFSARHLTKRKAFYKEADYPATVTKVTYR